MKPLNKRRHYFAMLKNRFWRMTEEEILTEYVSLCHEYNRLMKSKNISAEGEWVDEVISARDYLGHYIAQGYCYNSGYDI